VPAHAHAGAPELQPELPWAARPECDEALVPPVHGEAVMLRNVRR